MPIDDKAMQDAIANYNRRMAKYDSRNRALSGFVMCVGAALSWGLAATAAVSVLREPQVAADFDSGRHTRNVGGAGCATAVCAVIGLLLLSQQYGAARRLRDGSVA
jgi:drug/metabolite transporter (DMT)-like permease